MGTVDDASIKTMEGGAVLFAEMPTTFSASPYSAPLLLFVAPVRLVTKRPTDGLADSGETRSDTQSSVEVHGSAIRSRARTPY
jgi:hypothetical protein